MQSEIARTRHQIELERESARRGLQSYAIVTSHAAITKRMEDVGPMILLLGKQGRHEEAMQLWNANL
jgi:hypothetical protein